MSLTQINKAGLDELALDHVFTIGASGNDHYTFQGEGLNGTVNDPTLYLTRGKTYRFENGSGGHPIRIQSTSGASGTAYNTGVTNNAQAGTVIVEVQHDAPDVLYYQCTSHAAMNGILYITGALADGGVTTAKIADDAVTTAKIPTAAVTHVELANDSVITARIQDGAVTTAKIASDAVTTDKIGANQVTTATINANAVTTAKIADEAVTLAKLPHGTSSNDGKFLRANNGADPTFESIPAGITINNQADNRVITATGTTDTLNGEGNLTFDGTTLSHGTGGLHNGQKFQILGSGNSTGDDLTINNWGNSDGDYWTIGVNCTANSGGSLSKTTDALRHTAVILDGRMGRIIFNASETSTSTRTDTHTFERDGSIKMTGALYVNGDTAAANALDDYEEGHYVPTMYGQSGTTSFDLYSGEDKVSYQKVGNTVTIHGRIRINNNNFSGAGYMTLPFTAADNDDTDNAGSSAIAVHGVDYGGSRRTLFLETGGNSAYAWFLIVRDNASWLSANSSNLTSGSYLSFVHSYKAA